MTQGVNGRRRVKIAFLFLIAFFLTIFGRRPVLRWMESILKKDGQAVGNPLSLPARRALAVKVARYLAFPLPEEKTEPYLLRGDFLPGGEKEFALAAATVNRAGFLVLLTASGTDWRPLTWLGPDELGIPTSLYSLRIPGRPGEVLVMTDLADQMSGAFCRQERAGILGIKEGKWWWLWQRTIDSEAYWNPTWEAFQEGGWVALWGQAAWKIIEQKGRIAVDYENRLALGPSQAALPEPHYFVVQQEEKGREEYRWDPKLDLFVLGYGRLKVAGFLRGADGRPVRPPVKLSAGEGVAVLGDETTTPKVFSGRECLLRVYLRGQEGFLSPGEVDWQKTKE